MNINEYLEDKGLSCKQFADLIHANQVTVWRWKQRFLPSKKLAKRIVEVTDGEIAYEDMGWTLFKRMVVPLKRCDHEWHEDEIEFYCVKCNKGKLHRQTDD